MSFLLDTNVLSEWVKPRPDLRIVQWLSETDEDRIFISAVTLAELRYGIERLQQGSRRKRLDEWLRHELPLRFESRVLSVDSSVADAWGRIVARSEAVGRPISVIDAFLAATAEVHSLTLVTRDASDFEVVLKSIVNPWTQS